MKHSRRVEKQEIQDVFDIWTKVVCEAQLRELRYLVVNRHGEIGALLKAYE